VPRPLPPNPPLELSNQLLSKLSAADQALGRLDGLARVHPWVDAFVETVVRTDLAEAMSSARDKPTGTLDEAEATLRALDYGIGQLQSQPLSIDLLRRVHEHLLHGTRGWDRHPGEVRTGQNWLGGAPLNRAAFVPPPPDLISEALASLDRFLGERRGPILVDAALAHAQLLAIHPFQDGNGRIARMMVPLLLVYRGALAHPALSLTGSTYARRFDYHLALMRQRDEGDWEGWVSCFLDLFMNASEKSVTVGLSLLAAGPH
jgi:Fic family protein